MEIICLRSSSPFGVDLYGLAAPKAHGEALDQLALIGKGAWWHTRCPRPGPCMGEMKHSSVGMLGLKKMPCRWSAAAAEPGFFDHAHSQVRAVGSGIGAEKGNAQVVQVGTPVHQVPVMVLPGSTASPIHTGRGKNGLPHSFSTAWEPRTPGNTFLAPGQARHSGNAPLLPVLHLVGEGLENGIAVLSGLAIFAMLMPFRPSGSSEMRWMRQGRVST